MKGFLGIDVSKGYADFALIGENLELFEAVVQLDDTRNGHDNLARWLESAFKKYGFSTLHSAVESTGGLENNWYAMLKGLGSKYPLKIARLNPSVVKNAALAQLNANVTDAMSALNIARYLVRYHDKVDYASSDNRYSAYRSLFNHITLLTKQNTQIINELKQLLYVVLPELQIYCKQGIPQWVLELLKRYPTAKSLSSARPSGVSRIKGITTKKAKLLISKAKISVCSRGNDTDNMLISGMAEELMWKQKRLKEYKAKLAKICSGPEMELLETMKGIGRYSAAAIMIQIEDIERFASAKQLAAYFGVHPKLKISGDKKVVSRMSKQGRPGIRAVLYMCAKTAVLHDNHLKSIYAKHRAKGMAYCQAIGVIMHKMLRIIWGVLKSRKPYDPKVDKANQNLHTQEVKYSEIKEIESKRRFQSFDDNAPVSSKAFKKRKVHVLSQFGKAEDVRDPDHAPAV